MISISARLNPADQLGWCHRERFKQAEFDFLGVLGERQHRHNLCESPFEMLGGILAGDTSREQFTDSGFIHRQQLIPAREFFLGNRREATQDGVVDEPGSGHVLRYGTVVDGSRCADCLNHPVQPSAEVLVTFPVAEEVETIPRRLHRPLHRVEEEREVATTRTRIEFRQHLLDPKQRRIRSRETVHVTL